MYRVEWRSGYTETVTPSRLVDLYRLSERELESIGYIPASVREAYLDYIGG